jgi:uncharacterized protein YeaO (DUF488 family)
MTMTTAAPAPTVPKPQGLSDAATQAIAAKLVVDAYSNVVLQQPPFALDKVPDLGKHLALAQTNARGWVTQTAPAMVSRITDIIGFTDVWAAFGPTVRKRIQAGDSAGAVQLLEIMRDNHLKPLMISAHVSADDAAALQVLLAKDVGNFTADQTLGQSVYAGDKGAIAELEKSDRALQQSMTDMMTLAAVSAVGVVVGGLVIAVGLLAEIPSGGTSTAVVAAGILIVAGGIAGVGAGAGLYQTSLDEYRSNLEKIAKDKAEIAALTTMKGQVAALALANGKAQTALTALANSWTTVHGYFDNMIGDLQTGIDVPQALLLELDAADREWAHLATTAAALADNLAVPKVQVDLTKPASVVVKSSV